MAYLDENGREVLDQTPLVVPLRFKRQSFVDQIQALVRQELSRQAAAQEMESFEEADDFDTGEDWIRTPYEIDADQEFASLYPVEKDQQVEPDATKKAEPSEAAPEAGSGAA